MSVVSELKRVVPSCCQARKCEREGCSVSLAGAPRSRVVVNMDCQDLRLPENSSRCDYIVVSDEGGVCAAPLELKSGRVRVRTVVGQLQAGATWIAARIDPDRARLVPILAHNGIRKVDREQLRKQRIQFGGVDWRAVTVRCGETIAKSLQGQDRKSRRAGHRRNE